MTKQNVSRSVTYRLTRRVIKMNTGEYQRGYLSDSFFLGIFFDESP
jgi:hypothetical protein